MQYFRPANTRLLLLMASLQKKIHSTFANLGKRSFPQNKQERYLGTGNRYPNPISQLVQGGQKSKADIEAILAGYPSEIHDVALNYATDDYALLKSVDDLQNQTNQQFQQLFLLICPSMFKRYLLTCFNY